MELEKPGTADKFIGTLAEKIGAVAKAATVFGEPVTQNGITVIPVAKARWGFGGGAGQRHHEEGGGGGGGVQVTPVGFIEIRNDRAEFRPIRTLSLPWMIVGGITMLLLLRKTLRHTRRELHNS